MGLLVVVIAGSYKQHLEDAENWVQEVELRVVDQIEVLWTRNQRQAVEEIFHKKLDKPTLCDLLISNATGTHGR